MTRTLFITWLALLTMQPAHAANTFQAPEDFLAEAYAGQVPEPAVLWLTGDLNTAVTEILGHGYPRLRVRYWKDAERTAWILDEIGKDLPITVGILVNAGQIERLRVLVFRESRGWEVRYPFFTDQFDGARLTDDSELDRNIDNISGATLSVRAISKLARLALYFHQRVQQADVTP